MGLDFHNLETTSSPEKALIYFGLLPQGLLLFRKGYEGLPLELSIEPHPVSSPLPVRQISYLSICLHSRL